MTVSERGINIIATEQQNEHQQNEHQQQNYNQREHHHDYDYNNRARARACAREETTVTPDQMQRIKVSYEDNIGPITGAVAGMIEAALAHGLTPDEIVMACEETGFAPRPSPRYLRKVLMTWAETGVTVSRLRRETRANEALKWWRD